MITYTDTLTWLNDTTIEHVRTFHFFGLFSWTKQSIIDCPDGILHHTGPERR